MLQYKIVDFSNYHRYNELEDCYRCSFDGLDWSSTKLLGINFDNCEWDRVTFYDNVIEDCKFTGEFTQCDFENTVFVRCSFDVDALLCKFINTTFINCDINMRDSHCLFENCTYECTT